jgi:peptidoglycan/xylan/chitin deacetylase (PgdA/CDA1 family)
MGAVPEEAHVLSAADAFTNLTSPSQGIEGMNKPSVPEEPRDLRGYGRTPPKFSWPNGAHVAVSLVVNFEEGAELAISDGDASTETVVEVASVVPQGRWDQGTEQQFAYGTRVGVWRVLDALANRSYPITWYMCGRAVERLPDVAKEMVTAGHEAASHGWLWRPHSDYQNAEDERRDLIRCVDAMEKATGERPRGFFCRGGESVWTRAILKELGFEYTSNGFDDDLPYIDRTTNLLVVPYSLDTNDTKFIRPNGFIITDEFLTYVRESLEVMIEEGRAGAPKMLNIGFHLRISGRPGRIRAITKVLNLLATLGSQVWVARRIDIARFWMSEVQPKIASANR